MNTGCVLDTILWSFMAYLVISVANFFYIFLHFCTIKYNKIWNMFCSGRTQLGCCSFFLNILWEGREMACFKMSFILHCTKIKFPKTGFTVDHSALTFYVRWNVSVFLSLYMAFHDCFPMVLWFVLLVILIKNVYDSESVLSLLHRWASCSDFLIIL